MLKPVKGTLVLWNDAKGFGFVHPETQEREPDLFVHISVISNYQKGLSRRPSVGDTVLFEPLTPEEAAGRRRISRASILGINEGVFGLETEPGPWWSDWGLKCLAGLPILLSLYLFWRAANPIPLVSYIFMSALASLYFAADKRRALLHRWRVPEVYLHIFEMLGGWPGSLLSQKAFRHKNKKGHYRRVLWEIIGLHGLLWLIFLYHDLVLRKL